MQGQEGLSSREHASAPRGKTCHGFLVFPEVVTNTETPETEAPFLFRQELIFFPTFILSKTSDALDDC